MEGGFGVQVSGFTCLEFRQIRSIFVQHSLNGARSVTHISRIKIRTQGLTIHTGSFGISSEAPSRARDGSTVEMKCLQALGEDRLGCKHEERQVLHKGIIGTIN